MKDKINDPCLKCPKVGKATKEGNRYCNECPMKDAYLAAMFEACQIYTFREDSAMGIENRLQMWGGKPYVCPECKLGQFKVEVEQYIVPQEYVGIFKQPPETRAVIVCANCGKRLHPDQIAKEGK